MSYTGVILVSVALLLSIELNILNAIVIKHLPEAIIGIGFTSTFTIICVGLFLGACDYELTKEKAK